MKSKIKIFVLIFALFGFMFIACNKSEDLVTDGVKTGGLVSTISNFAYKLGATPTVDIDLNIPKGPAIVSIEVYNQYVTKAYPDTILYSNQVLVTTVDVSSANSTEDVMKNFSLTYTDLKKDLSYTDTVGAIITLPDDEALLPIGDNWVLTYVSVMADGRKVTNSKTTSVAVANRWAGDYLLSYYALRAGDPVLTGYVSDMPWELLTNGPKSVVYSKIHLWGDGAGTIGGIGPWVLTIDDSGGSDNPMPVVVSDPANPAVVNNPDYNNRYEPSTKTFYLSVYWGNGPTHRAAVDTLVYNGD